MGGRVKCSAEYFRQTESVPDEYLPIEVINNTRGVSRKHSMCRPVEKSDWLSMNPIDESLRAQINSLSGLISGSTGLRGVPDASNNRTWPSRIRIL